MADENEEENLKPTDSRYSSRKLAPNVQKEVQKK